MFKYTCARARAHTHTHTHTQKLPWWLSGKESSCQAGDTGLIPRFRKPLGEGNDNPLQYSCLESPMDRGAWWATVHGITKSQMI